MNFHNFPYQSTPFVGRSAEIADIINRVSNPACRLLTLTGPGGIGKTRLAIEVGSRLVSDFADGIYFVPLQSLMGVEHIFAAVAQAIHYQFNGADKLDDQLFRQLEGKHLCLILDNFDHLLEGATMISDLMSKAPDVVILATSRERLNLLEEWVYQVRGLKIDDLNNREMDAVQLFVQTALRARPSFSLDDDYQSVISICNLVEGMPLAIELSASWIQRLPVQTIYDSINAGQGIFDGRARNRQKRHSSMHATIDYSWDLLRDVERDVFKKLSVFRGGFRLEAAKEVAGTTRWELATLVDKSLLRIDTSGRYDLHELIRQYAEEQLNIEADERDQIHDLHCQYYLNFLAQRSQSLAGSEPKQAFIEIEDEIDNVRVAWDWAIPRISDYIHYVEPAFEPMAYFYDIRCWVQEGEASLRRLADAFDVEGLSKERPLLSARVLTKLSPFIVNRGDFDEAKRLLKRSLENSRQHGALEEVAHCLVNLAEVNYIGNTLAEGQPFVEESISIFTAIGDDSGRAQMLGYLGLWYHSYRDHARARQLLEESIALYHKIGGSAVKGMIYSMLAWVLMEVEEYALAQHFAEESLHLSEKVDWGHGIAGALCTLSECLYRSGQTSLGLECARRALRLSHELPRLYLIASTLIACAHILALQGKHKEALKLFSLTRNHPATLAHGLVSIDRGLRNLKTGLTTDQYPAILDRSQPGDLVSIAYELLQDWDHRMKPYGEAAIVDTFTRRELDVLQLLADGLTNAQIADKLVFTPGTVKWYLHQIYTKLDVTNRTQAVVQARELDIIS